MCCLAVSLFPRWVWNKWSSEGPWRPSCYISYWGSLKGQWISKRLESIYSSLDWKTLYIRSMPSATEYRCWGSTGFLTRVITMFHHFQADQSSGAAVWCWASNISVWSRQCLVRQTGAHAGKVSTLLRHPCWQQTGQLQGKLKPLCSAQRCFVWVQTVQERIPPLKRPKHWASQSLIGRTAKKELWSHPSEEDDKTDSCCTGNH